MHGTSDGENRATGQVQHCVSRAIRITQETKWSKYLLSDRCTVEVSACNMHRILYTQHLRRAATSKQQIQKDKVRPES